VQVEMYAFGVNLDYRPRHPSRGQSRKYNKQSIGVMIAT